MTIKKPSEVPLYRAVDPADPDVPKGTAWFYCECRPAATGSGYHVEARQRVIAWVRTRSGQVRPRLATGVVDARAWFNNDADRLLAGRSFVEVLQPDGSRKFWNPGTVLDPAELKKHMARLREIATVPAENAKFRKRMAEARAELAAKK